MATLNVFRQDPFTMISMTEAVERNPFNPTGIGELNIFEPFPIRTKATMIEERGFGTLWCLPLADDPGSVAAGVVTLTALNKGTLGNFIDIELNYFGLANNERTPAGITTDPSLAGVAVILGDTPYDFICSPYTGAAATTALTAMMNNTAGRWSPERLIYGHVWSADVGTEAALETLGASLNDPHLTIFGYEGGRQIVDTEAVARLASELAGEDWNALVPAVLGFLGAQAPRSSTGISSAAPFGATSPT